MGAVEEAQWHKKQKRFYKNDHHLPFKGRLHGAFSMCVSMSDKPFDAEACDMSGQASATNGLSDIKTHIENAPCNRPLTTKRISCCSQICKEFKVFFINFITKTYNSMCSFLVFNCLPILLRSSSHFSCFLCCFETLCEEKEEDDWEEIIVEVVASLLLCCCATYT
jgi:hypothetical protein